jgi:hypothetical protein
MPLGEFLKHGLAAHPDWSDRKLAAAIGVDHKTIASVRSTGEKFPS